MEDARGEVHYTFADNLAPYFLLIFSPIFVIICLFGIFYTYLTTEVRKYLGIFMGLGKLRGKKTSHVYMLKQKIHKFISLCSVECAIFTDVYKNLANLLLRYI